MAKKKIPRRMGLPKRRRARIKRSGDYKSKQNRQRLLEVVSELHELMNEHEKAQAEERRLSLESHELRKQTYQVLNRFGLVEVNYKGYRYKRDHNMSVTRVTSEVFSLEEEPESDG